MASLRHVAGALAPARRRGAAEPAAGGATCRYLAIIMDGNGRWAQGRGLPVAAGHRAGAKALRRVLEHALDLGIQEVTVYSFSTENWNRPQDEVEALMQLFVEMIDSQVPDMHERGARVRFVGRREGAPAELVRRIEEAEALTAANTRMTLYIAFSYGGRRELLDAAEGLAAEYAASAGAEGAPGAAAARRARSSPTTTCGATSTPPRCTTRSSSSAPRASSASATSCSGSAPTRSCTSATGTGPTSGLRTWTRRWPTTPAASAASAAAARPPDAAAPADPRTRRGQRVVTTRIITGVVLAVLAVVVPSTAGSSSSRS